MQPKWKCCEGFAAREALQLAAPAATTAICVQRACTSTSSRRIIMERVKQVAGLSWVGALVAVVAAMLASMVSFGFVVAVYAASSGELQVAMAKVRGAPASASAVVAAPRKPRSG
jgi:hypothetical protein